MSSTATRLNRAGAVFAADLLATVPGANIGENGFGGTSSLGLRGASSDKTLVLIDGVPVNDPSQPQGSFNFSSLDLASTQRIEVLSGPQGALWGSDAIGGVVSITESGASRRLIRRRGRVAGDLSPDRLGRGLDRALRGGRELCRLSNRRRAQRRREVRQYPAGRFQ